MKNRYLAVVMGITMAASSLTAVSSLGTATVFAAESSAEEADEVSTESSGGDEINTEETDGMAADAGENPGGGEMDEDGIRGQVVSVEEGKLVITTEDQEELEVTVTEDTVISKMTMGGGQPGDMSGGMEKPEGEEGEQPGEMGEAPEKPEGEEGEQPGEMGEAPEKPEGEEGEQAGGENGEIPEKPEGEEGEQAGGENGEAPEIPDGGEGGQPGGDGQMMGGASETEEITLEDIAEGDMVSVTLDGDTALTVTVMSMEMGGGPGGQASGVDSYDAANEYTEDTEVSDTALESTGTDENAALISEGAAVTFSNDTITRTSSESTGGDNASFYGVGAAVLVTDGTAYVAGSTVNTDSKGGAGLFAYGDGTVYAADTSITTQQDTSGGIHAAGGGTLCAWDLSVETNGESSAAIRSDRGGGTMVVDGGTYISNGVGSPAVYCTADIAVNNAELTANGSEGICIEGLNSLRLYNSRLTGNMSDDEQNDTTWTVILYQSMSGDSEVGNSTFQMEGGSITSQNGGLFYTTNTECTITLSGVNITSSDDSEFFLQCTGNNNQRGWGENGNNGSDCHFTADSQEMDGDVIWDSISDLDFYMTDGSLLEGAFIQDETWAGQGGDGYCNVYIDESSAWVVTGDSTVNSLSCAGSVTDEEGNVVSIVGTDGTVYVEGDSQYTVTVDSYQDTADMSGATAVDDWGSYSVEKPETI